MGIFAFDPATREMVLSFHHPGISADDIRRQTGWPLRSADDLRETPSPSAGELAAVRKYDPKGVWTS
jgi:acyl CoA:acetate/3-ketoacid CoA transferase beta subunit